MLQLTFPLKQIASILIGIAVLGFSAAAFADGTENLGTPLGVDIADGTDIVIAGTGLVTGQPQDINVVVPAGATVKQVLLYWGGVTYTGDIDTTATVNGIPVVGTLIGGPTLNEAAARTDITSLGVVTDGANVLSIGDIDEPDTFEPTWGAAVLVIYDEGTGLADIDIRDGVDWAYIGNAGVYMTTVPQTFIIDPAANTRTGTLSMLFMAVSGTTSGGGFRPSAIDVTINGSTQTFDNLLDSHDGQELDTLNLDVTIPGGTTMVTVQAKSVDNLILGGSPASFDWVVGSLSVPPGVDEEELCWITGGGFLNLDTDGTSGSKSFSFGGNVGPPPHGSWNVVDHDTGDKFHTNEVHIVGCEVIAATGPGQPGGKKGFDLNKANFAGTGTLNGIGGCPFTGYVIDGGEPQGKNGNDNDAFHLETTDAGICGGTFFVDGEMPGGNFQIHPPTGP
jgi:hypothetical protein